MCDYAADLEPCDVWNVTKPRARKAHRCDCCGGTIEPGEQYVRIFSIFDNHASSEKSCQRCDELAEAFQADHTVRSVPSYMPEMYAECVLESRGEGNAESAERWQAAIDEIDARRKGANR